MLLYLCSMFLPKCNSSRLANLNSHSSQMLGGTCTQKFSDVTIQRSEGGNLNCVTIKHLWNFLRCAMFVASYVEISEL